MISVRIPKEIRSYKEKLAFGLTARQIIAVVIAAIICIPTYIYGRQYLSDDVISWIIILIAGPCVAFGFFTKNGMTFEKYAYAIIKNQVLYPQKTSFKADNFYRNMQNQADKLEIQKYSKKKLSKYKEQATLERAYLIEEMEKSGEYIDMKKLDDKLVTVSMPSPKKDKKEKNNKVSDKEKKKSKAQIVTEEVEQKRKNNPTYIPTRKEGKYLLAYAKEREKQRIQDINKAKKQIQKKNIMMNKRHVAKSFIPKSTQDDLPYIADFEEGLFEVEKNKYSKCYALYDINYRTAKEEDQISIFCRWGEFINSFADDMNIGIVIDNRIISLSEQEKKVYYQLTGDEYDIHRNEYNSILKRQMISGNNDIQQTKFITITITEDSPYEALLRFHTIDREINENLHKVGTYVRALSTDERLALLHDKMRKGREGEFNINYDFLKMSGLSSKDYVAPSSFLFKNRDYFMIEDTYYRCMYISNLPATLSDEFINDLTKCNFPVITNINIQPVDQEKALRMVRKQLTGMEANKIEAEKKAIKSGYNPETISHDLKQSLSQGEQLLDDMTNKDQKMFYVSLLVMTCGESLEQLNENAKILAGKVRKYACQLQTFDNQQRDAFKVTLPMGVTPNEKIFVERALTTESTSIFIPFSNQELFQVGGFYYGLNQISRNLILCNRTEMKSPSGFIFGSSGSGKSFACKREMLNVLLADSKTGLLVIDPEGEYVDLAKAFGGTVLELSSVSDTYINPMDMDENYGIDDPDEIEMISLERKKEKALKRKSEYLMSIIHFMMSDSKNSTTITPQQKTIIDQAIRETYQEYLNHNFDKQYVPTLLDLQNKLDEKASNSDDGKKIADAVAFYTRGSMDLFSHLSNIDFSNRFIVFNIRDLKNELEQISLMIVLDFIWNRMTENSHSNIRTYCYVDEIHVLFRNAFSESYIQQLYKRGRKYGLVISGITQDLTDLLTSDVAKTMITNSDFIMMLNQNGENIKLLADLLGISDTEIGFISKAEKGSGLLFAEKTIIPFIDQFPTTSYLYTLMSTKFGEDNKIKIEDFISELQDRQKNLKVSQNDISIIGR